MFERYTEKARRIIFFARYEASEFGSPCIETEHLLLGLLREDKALANRFLPSNDSVASIRQRIRALTPVREKISTSVDLPLSHESKRVLAYSAEEAETLKHRHIGPEHLLLGLLREENSLAANLLRERGLSIERVREDLGARGADSPASPGNALQIKLLKYLESHHNELRVSAAGPHIYVGLPHDARHSCSSKFFRLPTASLKCASASTNISPWDFVTFGCSTPAPATSTSQHTKPVSTNSREPFCAPKTPLWNSLSPKFSHNFTLVRLSRVALNDKIVV